MAVHEGQIWANNAQLNSVVEAFAEAAPLRTAEPKRRNPFLPRAMPRAEAMNGFG
jgi:hypothetical protein